MNNQSAIDFVKEEIGEYIEYLYKYKSLEDFYKATRNVIAFRLENHIYNFSEADKALSYLDDFFRKQEVIRKQKNEISKEYGHKDERDDDER